MTRSSLHVCTLLSFATLLFTPACGDLDPPAFDAARALAPALSTLPDRQQPRTRVVLLPNGFANNGVKGMIAATAIESNAPRVRVDVVQNCPEGNAASFKRMSDTLLELDVDDEAKVDTKQNSILSSCWLEARQESYRTVSATLWNVWLRSASRWRRFRFEQR